MGGLLELPLAVLYMICPVVVKVVVALVQPTKKNTCGALRSLRSRLSYQLDQLELPAGVSSSTRSVLCTRR